MNRRRFLKWSLAAAVTAGAYPFAEPYLVRINHYQIPLPRLPRAFDGFTIVQLTDLHYAPWTPLAFFRWVLAAAMDIRRDIIVCTGDYVDRHRKNTVEDIDAIWPLLTELTAPLGVYSVLGNHDHRWDGGRSLHWLERSGQNLRNRVHCFTRDGQRLWLAGGGDLLNDHLPFDPLLAHIPAEDCRIVLAHNPDSADTSFVDKIDLMICGHTHGGQVNIPFYGPLRPVTRNPEYNTSGLKLSRKKQPVFIATGIGAAVLPVRFNCPPEIAVLELKSP